MEANAKDNRSYDYAASRAAKRDVARHFLAQRVRVPVNDLHVQRTKKSPTGVKRFILYVSLSVIFHGSVVVVFSMISPASVKKSFEERAVFQVVESPVREPVAPVEEPEPALEKQEETVVEEISVAPSKTPVPTFKRRKMAKSDPVNQVEPVTEPQKQRRAIVGIAMSSTVTGGTGPSYAVGNTRMGQTAAVQTEKKILSLSKGKSSGQGGPQARVQANRAAAFIPTVSTDFEKPKRLNQTVPSYPVDLKSKGIEGNVVMLIVINERGEVQKVRVLRSSGYREFDEAALNAAQKEIYRPAQRDGKAIEYNLKYTYRFRMKGA